MLPHVGWMARMSEDVVGKLEVFTDAVVVDTSVVFKWFETKDESEVEEARELMDAHAESRLLLAAPSLLPHELTNALLSRGVNPSRVLRAMHALRELCLAVIEPTEDVIQAAIEIHANERITYYDALFAALAADLEVPLVTADRKQARTEACQVRLVC